ncbi:MAG: outer membrane lipoprotein carrier protein LolA [Bacteroidales bacterium]|jgi:outer membrane lipoprotein-sorting protein|nr:outer membrane lipoprotein carrier protein LolA [Bacteroidales bacterium]
MTIRNILSIIVLFSAVSFANAQTDPAANAVLDKFSAQAANAPSVSLKFNLITDDMAEKTSDTLNGTVIISKDRYKLEIPNNIIWFDGVTSWSYLMAEDEVTVTRPDKNDNSFQNKPSGIFTMYRSGYKTRIIEDKPDTWVIDLYPEDIKSNLIRVRLTIGKSRNDLKKVEYRRNDGIVIYIQINEYSLNIKPEPNLFVFSKEKYKNAEVIDMR